MKAFIVANLSTLALAGAAFLYAGAAAAQVPATASTSADQAATTAPLKLQLPEQDSQPFPQAGGADSPGEYFGDGKDNGVEIHGSVTTGIGYSKGYGTSKMNAVELHISKPYGDGNTFDMHIHAEKTEGPGFSPYNYPYGAYYGPRYR